MSARGESADPADQGRPARGEIAAIHALARRLARDLESRDPLSERVHLGKAGFALVGGLGALRFLASALMRSVRRAAEGVRMTASRRRPAAHSSFYMAMRILPAPQREAMFALYGFCRAVDDIADERGPATAAQRLAELERWRADVAAMFAGHARRRVSPPSIRPSRDFDLKQKDFDAVIDGMAMDAAEDIRAPDWATLDLYCDRVASAVGRLSVRIFGLAPEPGEALAHHLGRALQLTNILRDIDEDAAVGRLYLPREALAAAGVTTDEPLKAAADPKLARACAEVAARARAHFEKANSIMAAAPRAAVRAPRSDGRRIRLDPRPDARGRLRAAAAAREGEPACAFLARVLAVRHPVSAGAVHVIGAGIAGLSAAMRLVEAGRKVIVHEAASVAGGRCRSYHDPTLGLVIDNGNHLLLSGNHAGARLSRSDRSARRRCTIPAPRSSTSRTSRTANAGGSISAKAVSRGGCSIARGACRARRLANISLRSACS